MVTKGKILIEGIGKSSDIDDTYNEARYIVTRGIVKEVGGICDMSMLFMDYKVNELIDVETEVITTYHGIQQGAKVDGGYIIDYAQVIAYIDDGEIVPINGNVILDCDNRVISVACDIDYIIGDVNHKPQYPNLGDVVISRFLQPLERKVYQQYEDMYFCNVNLIECSYGVC